MEVVLNIETTFESVFLINGKFFENAKLRIESSEIVYITVLPLDARLIPYTVKLLGHRPLNLLDLCLVYKLSDSVFYLRLLERYNYIYTTKKQQEPAVSNNIYRFFKLVKQKHYPEARSLMTTELSASIDNNSLDEFLSPFNDIVENKSYLTAPFGSYFLINSKNVGTIFVFEIKSGLIDNIYEYENDN